MRLSVLLTFLLALAHSSGLRCQTAQKNQEGFSEFSKKHILAIDIKGNWKVNYLNKVFKEYLQRHDLCGRVDLQTFFRRSDTERVEKVCSDKGFEYDGNNENLCISEQQFTVYMVESTSTGPLFGQCLSSWMKLAVLLTYLIALALGSGSRCKHPWKNQQGYNEFSEKHILSMVVKGKLKVKELNDMFKDYLQKHDLCGRVELQTFFRQCDRGKVEYICNGQGFIDGTGNLCITVDASLDGLGTVLSQRPVDETKARPIAFASKTLSVSQKRMLQVIVHPHYEVQFRLVVIRWQQYMPTPQHDLKSRMKLPILLLFLLVLALGSVVLHNYTFAIADPFDSSCSCTYEGIDAITGARW
ncbi:hypothetical protein NFI96_002275 [Prochilodus magdalenae]|nr:hypothetical protein NFI96_002275 [Prochilodus magdalenae]